MLTTAQEATAQGTIYQFEVLDALINENDEIYSTLGMYNCGQDQEIKSKALLQRSEFLIFSGSSVLAK